MCTTKLFSRTALMGLCLWALTGMTAQADTVTLHATPSGDANYAWNSKYGSYGYSVGEATLSAGLYFGPPYGNDYTMGFMELPLTGLIGQVVENAELRVHALGFGTGYYYGSAGLGWLDTTGRVLTGDVVADGLGGMHPSPGGWAIWSTDMADWQPGWKSVDVTTQMQQDLDQGRTYSSFYLWASRDTWGSIHSAESGLGPYLSVTLAPVPEADEWALILVGLGLLALRLRSNAVAARRTHV